MGSKTRSAGAFRSGTIMACRALICLTAVLLAAPAMAMADSARFNITAQPMATALKAFAEQAHMQLLYQYDAVSKLSGNSVSGTLDKRAALEQLLKNTGLEAVYSGDNAATIRPIGVSTTTQGTAQPTENNPSQKIEKEKSAEERFRVAQVDQGQATSPAAVAKNAEPSFQVPVIQEVIVTAQKREERLQDVPISISVLGGKDLDSASFTGATDALNTLPGITATPNTFGGVTQVTIRGVTAASAFFSGSSPIGYYIDSVPFGFIRTALAPDLNVFDLSRIEALRGPQGTLYGASAEGGLIRVLTNDPDLNQFGLKARVTDSSTVDGGNNYGGDIAVNVPIIDGKLGARAVVGYENDSGWIDTPTKSNVNDAELHNYRLKVNAQPTDHLSIALSAWSTRDNAGAPASSSGHDFNPSVFNLPISIDWDAYGARINYQFSGFSVTSATSYLDYANSNRLDIGPQGFPGTGNTYTTSNVLSEELYLASTNDSDWRWTAGGMYRRAREELFQSIQAGGVGPAFPIANQSDASSSKAVFAELTRRFFGGQLEATAGFRHFYDDESQTSVIPPTTPPTISSVAQANTPRAVLTWHPNDHTLIYSSYSQGFRSGFPQQAGVNLPPPAPDRLRNYELGMKGAVLGGVITYDTAVYYVKWSDVQQFLSVLQPSGVTFSGVVNGPSASGTGFDLSLATQPLDGLTLSVSFSWNDLEFDSTVVSGGLALFDKGTRLDFSPETTTGVSAQYAFAIGSSGLKGRFALSGNYTSKQTSHSLLATGVAVGVGDDMFTGRSSLSVDFPDHLTASLFADNLTNTRNVPVRSPISPAYDLSIRPRTVGLQLGYRY